jgi:hypothetical protein
MPEMTGDITPKDLAQGVLDLLRDDCKRALQREELRKLSRGTGAAERIVSAISRRLGIG